MCGVFGYIAADGCRPNLKRLEEIAVTTERRGPHAFGMAWIDGRGRIRSFKQSGRISDHLSILAMAADARMIIGHCRYATVGDPKNNLNNHPHACDGGWMMHNGTIPNYEAINEEFNLAPVTDCDSETIALLIETLDGSLPARVAQAMEIVDAIPAVVLGLWKSPARLVVARRGNPLRVGRAASGVYIASLRGGMPANTRTITDDTVTVYRHCNGDILSHEEKFETYIPADEVGSDDADLFTCSGGTADRNRPHSYDTKPASWLA